MPTKMRKVARAALLAVQFAEQNKIDTKFRRRHDDRTEFLAHREESNALNAWYADCLAGIAKLPMPTFDREVSRRAAGQESDSLSALEVFFIRMLGGLAFGSEFLPVEQQIMYTALTRMIQFGMAENLASFTVEAVSLARLLGYVPSPPLLAEPQPKKPALYIVDVLSSSQPKERKRERFFSPKPRRRI